MKTNQSIIVTLCCILAAAGTLRAADDDISKLQPKPLIEKLTKEVVTILRSTPDKLERRAKVQKMADPYLDFDTMAKLAMGRGWRDLNEQQRADFVKEFKLHLIATYGHTTDDYTDEDVTVTGDREETDKDYTVLTKITGTRNGGPRQEVAKVEYRIRKRDNGWKVIDVPIAGISLVANFRAQFAEVINNGGYEKLMRLLREKNAGT
jgi:phospholipid transport system substrate-binding protein